MPSDFFSIEPDTASLLAALARAPEEIQARVTAAAEVTAQAIAADAKARVHRRSGTTAEGIAVRPDGTGGFWIDSNRQQLPNLPLWMEFGTIHEKPEKYFFVSADLERDANERRMVQAIEDGLADAGFTD